MAQLAAFLGQSPPVAEVTPLDHLLNTAITQFFYARLPRPPLEAAGNAKSPPQGQAHSLIINGFHDYWKRYFSIPREIRSLTCPANPITKVSTRFTQKTTNKASGEQS